MMRGEIDWSALPWLARMLGVDDLDTVTTLLLAIRDRRDGLDKD